MADEMNKERESFEAWHRTTNWPSDLGQHEGRYMSNIADASWQAWQARASLAASAGSEPVAYAMFADNGNIRLWSKAPIPHPNATPLYTHPTPPEGAGWRPIETAPRDGTPIWLYTLAGQCEGYWNYGEWVQDAVYCTYDGAGGPAFECNPTHWMPLPKAPAPPASEAKGA